MRAPGENSHGATTAAIAARAAPAAKAVANSRSAAPEGRRALSDAEGLSVMAEGSSRVLLKRVFETSLVAAKGGDIVAKGRA